MKTFLLLLGSFMVMAGCARVQVEAPKEPIKVDISMRLDVYQHVERDIDKIEKIVTGSDDQGLLNFFVTAAYADEGLSPDVEQAALRRRDRHGELTFWQTKGVVGENRSGLVEIRKPGEADAAAQALVKAENSDRMVIYKGVAEKNGTSIGEVQKLYANRLQDDAPAGTPVEVLNEAGGASEWKIK